MPQRMVTVPTRVLDDLLFRFMQTWFLNPSYLLRRQLLTSYGFLSVMTLGVVISMAIVCSFMAGDIVTSRSNELLHDQALERMIRNSQSVADTLSSSMENLEGTIQIITELVQDRIVGYHPYDDTGWLEDEYVPFYDTDTKRNVYPLQSEPLLLDWQVQTNILVNETLVEHLQERQAWIDSFPNINTARGSYFFQGVCNPLETNKSAPTYYPQCTDENNNVRTGGRIYPSSVNYGLYTKSADFVPLFKPLYEAHPEIFNIGVYFHNQGAGSYMQFPADARNGNIPRYTSRGCEWMLQLNPYTGKPFGTIEQVQKCHPPGTLVPQREYNVNEREWCQHFIQHHQDGVVQWFGPFWYNDGEIPILIVGKSVFDRVSHELIGCVGVVIALEDMNKFLMDSKIHKGTESSEMSVVHFEDGVIFADTLNSIYQPGEDPITFVDTKLISEKNYQKLKDCIQQKLNKTTATTSTTTTTTKTTTTTTTTTTTNNNNLLEGECYVHCHRRKLVYTAHPLLLPRDEKQHNGYPFQFILVQSRSQERLQVSKVTIDQINSEVMQIIILSVTVGIAGIVFVFGIVWCVSRVLTQPLLWMERVAWGIVNHNHASDLEYPDNNKDEENTYSKQNDRNDYYCYWRPKTEIAELVSEFRRMIQGFSGTGASTVAEADLHEIRNALTWQSDYQQLYGNHANIHNNNHTNNGIKLSNSAMDLHCMNNNGTGVRNHHHQQQQQHHNLNGEANTDPLAGNVNDSDNHQAKFEKSNSNVLTVENSGTENNPVRASTGSDDQIDNNNNNNNNNEELLPHQEALHLPEQQQQQQQQQDVRLKMTTVVPAPLKTNLNSNILSASRYLDSKKCFQDHFNNSSQIQTLRSSLFWWILLLIVIPMLLTNALICFIVSERIMNTVPSWVDSLRENSIELERGSIRSVTTLKAIEIEMSIQRMFRDLHLMTRVAGWLVFDGINRSGSFTYMEQAAEECKHYPERTCPFFDTPRASCACEWEDAANLTCKAFNNNTRPSQHRFFIAEKRDFYPFSGDRLQVVNKENDSPDKTLWFNDTNDLPGALEGRNASGYNTTYAKARVASAMAMVEIPIYRRALGNHRSSDFVASYVTFDRDGLTTGYQGCQHNYALASQFKSTIENKAEVIAPKLCPLGKHGYDPRCRKWFAAGKEAYEKHLRPVHIAAPYKFALNEQAACSVTSPIANIATGEYVGQTLIDFFPTSVNALMGQIQQSISFVITPDLDPAVQDTVVGLNKDANAWKPARIVDLLYPHGNAASVSHRDHFENEVLPKLRNGESGETVIRLVNENGEVQELTLVYRPIIDRVLLPLQPDDFSRGVNVSDFHTYTIGVAYSEESINAPWDTIDDDIDSDLGRLRIIYMSVVVVISSLFMLITCRNTLSVTRPMIILLRVVQTINAGKTENGIPPLQGGSREVLQVYNSFTKLYKIVRVSNVAFFSGNLTWAYDFITDALKLFRKVGDEKAIGVACSNLGNTLHAMYHDELNTISHCNKLVSLDVTKTALEHYDEAIHIGEMQLQDTEDELEKADFVQQLADRVFNRALFKLLSVIDGTLPSDEKASALNDIQSVRMMDREVKLFWLDRKLLLKKSDVHFFRLLQRSLGLLEYYDLTKDIWDVGGLVKEADQLLFAAWNEPSAPLFEEISRVGRLQQLESVAIQLELVKENKLEAARLSMRMFVEDEYLIEEAFKWGSTALLSIFRDPETWPNPRSFMIKSILEADLRKMLRSCKQISLDIGKCIVFAFEINEVWEGHELLDRINSNCLSLYDGCCSKDDYMGVVAYTTKGDLNVPLGIKCENEGYQRSTLDLATTSTSERACSAFPYATQILVDCTATTETDSFILLITDGFSWDSMILSSIRRQIETLNAERFTTVHVIIFGIEIEEKDIVDECKSMCKMSNMSKYMDITLENVDYAFETVKNLLRGGVVNTVYNHGIIMEKF